MSHGLQHVGDDGPLRCRFCARDAVGPCARCRAPVCAECCTLTEGGTKTWAICLDCDRRGGRSLAGAWGGVLVPFVAVLVALAVAVAVLAQLSDR